MTAKNHLPPISLTVSNLTSKNYSWQPPGTTLTSVHLVLFPATNKPSENDKSCSKWDNSNFSNKQGTKLFEVTHKFMVPAVMNLLLSLLWAYPGKIWPILWTLQLFPSHIMQYQEGSVSNYRSLAAKPARLATNYEWSSVLCFPNFIS